MNLKYLRLRSSLSLSVNVSLNYNSSDQEKVSQTAKWQFSDKQSPNCNSVIHTQTEMQTESDVFRMHDYSGSR